MARRPRKQTSAEMSTIAAKHMTHEDPEVRSMAASLLSQDETPGQTPQRATPQRDDASSVSRAKGKPVREARRRPMRHQKLDHTSTEANEPEVPNVNKVPKRMWKKWSRKAQAAFNSTFAWAFANQSLMVHPKMKRVAVEQWKTIAWNAAWICADHVDNRPWSEPDGKPKVAVLPPEVTTDGE